MHQQGNKRKLGRETGQRAALVRGLACELVKHGSMQTTLARAKEVRPFIEKLLTRSRTGTVAARRIVSSRLGSEDMMKRLVEVVAPKMVGRAGGYTRITKLAPRTSDQAALAVIEFVQ